MDKYQETFNTWNKVAKLYEEKFMHLDLYNDTYDIFCDAISKKNAAVLEIGCGPGNITAYILTQRPDLNIAAIDISPNMIALAKDNCPAATFTVMDSREIHTLESTYDAILCGFCLPYLSASDREKLIADCAQLLNANGIFYLSFVEGDENTSGYQAGSSGNRTYFYYHDLNSLKSELVKNMFEITHLLHKRYAKSDGSEEVHTVLMGRKQ